MVRQQRVSLSMREILFIQGALALGAQGTFTDDLQTKLCKVLAMASHEPLQKLCAAYKNAVPVKDGELELDLDAEVSLSEDGGAYVQVWLWVSAEDAGLYDLED